MTKRLTKKAKVILIITMIISICSITASIFLILNRYRPVSINEYVEDISVIIDDNIVDKEEPILSEDIIYFSSPFIKEYISDNFYLDEKDKILTYTDYYNTIRIEADKDYIYINGEKYRIKNPFMWENDTMYIPSDYLIEQFKLNIKYIPSLKRIIIDTIEKTLVFGQISSKSVKLYEEPNKKSKVIFKLNYLDNVRIFNYNESDEWFKVRSQNGFIGYVEASKIINVTTHYTNESYNQLVRLNDDQEKITMVWHQVFNKEENKKVIEKFSNVTELDVISPTWFSLSNKELDKTNLASKKYVDWAHEMGYKVWALIDNGFDSELTKELLQSTKSRQEIIENIVDLAIKYELDGINIDFENVSVDTGIFYVQFIKELAPRLRANDIITSVDVYVPSAWTSHYKRDELAKAVDYVVIMAYDEHWAGSEKSGSVSSINFVEKAIIDTLKEVPKEKIILGVPFYTRLWVEEVVDGELKLTSKAMGMESAFDLLVDNNAEISWLKEVGQYYGEYYVDNKTYKIWLEDEHSLEEKIKKAIEYDLAGISAWKKGLEKDSIWQLLSEYN